MRMFNSASFSSPTYLHRCLSDPVAVRVFERLTLSFAHALVSSYWWYDFYRVIFRAFIFFFVFISIVIAIIMIWRGLHIIFFSTSRLRHIASFVRFNSSHASIMVARREHMFYYGCDASLSSWCNFRISAFEYNNSEYEECAWQWRQMGIEYMARIQRAHHAECWSE